jgi:uncharacterized protein GlcG (DUF336 family)
MTAHAKSLTQSTLSLEQASVLASEAVKSCSAKGYNVSVTVVDAAGVTRAVQRMDNAGPHTLTASCRKHSPLPPAVRPRASFGKLEQVSGSENLGAIFPASY